MEFTDCHFTYAGVSSRRYGVKFANCNTSRYVTLNGTTKTATVFTSRGNRNYFAADSLSDSAVSFDAEIITDDVIPLTVREMRDIEKWLFNRKGFYRLYIDSADDCNEESYEIIGGEIKQYYINCRMTNPSKIEGNGGVVGFKFKIETDSCMAWQDEIKKTITPVYAADHSCTFNLDIDTDMDEYVYPKVKFTMTGSGSSATPASDGFSLSNTSDSNTRYTSFADIGSAVNITIDGNYNSISPSQYYTKFSNRNFVRLVPGINTLTLLTTGSVADNVTSIEITYSQRRYL